MLRFKCLSAKVDFFVLYWLTIVPSQGLNQQFTELSIKIFELPKGQNKPKIKIYKQAF